MVGAHLDSVEAGPGINDNGSGSSTLIEMAEQIGRLGLTPENRLRFAFWGAEEAGLVGSTAYVNELVEEGTIDSIEANLNFDMVGSPNFVRFVYDGDLSDSAPPPGGAPNGSGQIEGVFADYFRARSSSTTRRRSTAARTTGRSSRTAYPQAACSPALRASRRRARRGSTEEPLVRRTTRATTRHATRSPT